MADTKISDLTAVTDVISTDEYVLARAGTTKKIDASDLLVADAVAFTPAGTIAATDVQAAIEEVSVEASAGFSYVLIREQQTQNTQGGTFTSGAWQTRTLNTESADTDGIATLGSNQITLAAGTYACMIVCPGAFCGKHQARLQNVTDAATLLIGTSTYSGSANTDIVVNTSVIMGQFTIGASKALEVQHQCSTTRATDGFGVASNFTTEVYTVAQFWKIG